MGLSDRTDIVFSFKYTKAPNLKVASALLIFTIFSIPFSETTLSNQPLFVAWLGVGAFVTSIVIGFLFLANYLFTKRFGDKIPLALILATSGCIGGLKGASTEYLVNSIALYDPFPLDEIAIRAYSGSFLGVGLAFALSLKATYSHEIKQSFNKYRLQNQKLAEEVATLAREIKTLKESSTDRILEKIVRNISPIKSIDVLADEPEKNWRKISEALRIGLAKRVREESYDLNYLGDKPPSIKRQIQQIFFLKKVNLYPKVLALVQFSTGASITYVDWNPRNSFLQLILNTVVSIVVTTFFRNLLTRRANPTKIFNFGIISGVILVNGSLYALVGYIFWSKFDPIFQISLFFWHTFLVLTISSVSEIIQYMSAQRHLQESVHQDLIDKKRVFTEHLENLRHEISKHLHGYLVTKIHTTATSLDDLAEKGDFESYRRELSQLLDEFTIDGLRASLVRDVINPEYFSSLIDSWSELIRISIQAPDNLNQIVRNAQRVELAHVIEELVSNAYRHGEASSIRIEITWLDETNLEIVATDNGRGTISPVKQGLGSRIFAAASDGNWSLRDIPYQGVEVRLAIILYTIESQVGLIPEEHEDAVQPASHTP